MVGWCILLTSCLHGTVSTYMYTNCTSGLMPSSNVCSLTLSRLMPTIVGMDSAFLQKSHSTAFIRGILDLKVPV